MGRSGPNYSYVNEWKRLWEPDLEALAFNGATCDPTRVDPKVLEWVKQHCAQKPHFIKVIIQSSAANRTGYRKSKLVVPSPFVEQHFRQLERVVKLENEGGRTWRVAFGLPTRQPMWGQGWHRFAVENHLKCGDVLVFVLVGLSHFHFTHFDENGNQTSNANSVTFQKECNPNSSHSQEYSEDHEHVKTRASPSQRNDGSEPPHDEVVIPGIGFDRHTQDASLHSGQSGQQIEDPQSRKRRKLIKVGEKLKECVAEDSEEDGRTSMPENGSNGADF